MASGFDTTANAGNLAPLIKTQGYKFVGRYLSKSTWKLITPPEAAALKVAGLGIILVYEDSPTTPTYFSSGRGTSDAGRAIAQAKALDAPAGTAIYFAVDYDASATDVSGRVASYFNEIAAALAADPSGYVAGVYGSGRTCQAISAAGTAKFTWRAQSTGWAGYALPGPWSIVQGVATVACTLSVDLDTVGLGAYGAM
jgi:hypothetical protein